MKEFFSSIKAFIKKNVFSCLCLLLSFLVCITGSLSYAKYISSAPATGGSGVGSFSADVKINGVSSLSFTNTAFWGGTSETDKIAMNALREIEFSVKNYQEDELGNKKVSAVKMGYDLVFESPQNFGEKLAMQLFNEESDPITPQIVVEDFIKSCQNGTKYNTQDSEDYVSAPYKNVSFNTDMEEGSYYKGVYYDDETGITTTIRVEFDQVTTHQQLYLRAWNNEASTNEPPYYATVEGGKILPPVVVQYTNTLNTYRIFITMSDFFMPAGEECEKNYMLQLAPTNTINDQHLGGYFVQPKVDANGNVVKDEDGNTVYTHVQSIYGPDAGEELKDWRLQTIHEEYIDTYYKDNTFNEILTNTSGDQIIVHDYQNILGSPKHYKTERVEEPSTEIIIPDASPSSGGKWEEDPVTNTIYTINGNDEKENSANAVFLYFRPSGNEYIYLGSNQFGKDYFAEDNIQQNYIRVKLNKNKSFTKSTTTTSKIESGSLLERIDLTYDYKVISESHENGFDHYDMEVIEDKTITYVVSGDLIKTTTHSLSFAGNGNVTIQGRNDKNNKWENKNNPSFADLSSKIQVPASTKETIQNHNITQTIKQTRYYKRDINRYTHTTDIKIEAIEWTVKNDKGEDQKVNYTTSNPLELFRDYVVPGTGETVKRQYIYLSQCYSKNYPFFVNVVFEQVQ